MMGYEEALARLLAEVRALDTEAVPIAQAIGRVLATDVTARVALPGFDHAAMDGYALAAAAGLHAGSEHAVAGTLAAGEGVSGAARAAEAIEIMTGAPLPPGLDTVVAVERTDLLTSDASGQPLRIRLHDAVTTGANVRRAGSDFAAGEVIEHAGVRLRPPHAMAFAACGIARVEVIRQPRVCVIGTGRELVDDPAQPLGEGQIYSSNAPYLEAALAAAGAEVIASSVVEDHAADYLAALAASPSADLVISTGAVSMGRYDFVPEAVAAIGGRVLFHGVAMRPGKPLFAAALPGGGLLLALPGTPMAVAAAMRFFVMPVLRAMRAERAPVARHARLQAAWKGKPGLRHFLRGRVEPDAAGVLQAQPLPQQEPFRMRPFVAANAWLVMPEQPGEASAGSLVEVHPLDAMDGGTGE